jgi:hypothetical protein
MELAVDDLLLDPDNPRIGSANSQAEALEAIVRLDVNHFRTMMQSISDNGLDPGDSFYIIAEAEEGGGYTVVDGNRRLAALKVLHEPAILQGTELSGSVIKRLAKVAENFDAASFALISCVLFESRTEADEWILRRHGRKQEGEARIPWGSLEIQRFQKDRSILDVIDFVERNSTFSDAAWNQIRAEVEAKPSVLGRFLETKRGRDWLGLSIREEEDERIPTFSRPPRFVLDVLATIFEGIHTKIINSRTHNKAREIELYFENLPKNLHPKGAPSKEEIAFRDAIVNDGEVRPRLKAPASAEVPAKSDTKSRTSKTKPPRSTLAPSRHAFRQPSSTKGQALVREASRLRLTDTPLSAAFVLRAFLQHTLETFMSKMSIPMKEKNTKGVVLELDLPQKAERVLQYLVDNKISSSANLRAVKRTLTNRADPASIQSLNNYHHDKYDVPAADVLRNAWDTAEPLFVAVYGTP